MTSRKSLFIGMVLGSVIGGVTTLLTTPSSGKVLRFKINDNKNKLVNSFDQIKNDGLALKEQVEKSTKESVGVITTFSENIKDSAVSWSIEAEKSKKSIQRELSEIENSLKKLEQTISLK